MTEHQANPLAGGHDHPSVLREPDRAELVAVNRTELRVWRWGDATAPPVLMLHGAYDHGRMFDDLAPRVAALGYHAIALDFRGHGDSGPLDTGFAWALLHLDLALLVRDIIGTAVGVIAHSFGAGQAIGLAGAFPELVRWLVVMDGLGPPPDAVALPDDIRAAIRTNAARTDRILFDRHRREWPSVADMAAYRRSQNPRLTPAWAEHLARHGSRRGPDGGYRVESGPDVRARRAERVQRRAPAEEQRRVQCPVLVITGTEHDTWRDLTPEQEAERVGWLRARHVTVPGTGHYVHLEDPEGTMAAMRGFVDEVEHDRRTAPRPR